MVLAGFTVGVTADRRWEEQALLFERRGAAVLHGPVIRTLAVGDGEGLRDATDAVLARRPSAVIANTGIGMRSWFSAAETWGIGDTLVDVLRRATVVARGPKASGVVHSYGIDVEASAGTERLRDAVDVVLATVAKGSVVALQLDGRGANPETVRLRAAGLDVIEVPAYEWRLPDDDAPALRLVDGVVAGRVHAVTFTAAPAVQNLLSIASEHGLDDVLRTRLTDGSVVVGCVGPVCADAARDEGLASPHLAMPARGRLGPLVRCVSDALARRTIHVSVGGAALVLAGTRLTVDGADVALTDTEAQVLRVLAARPNAVVAKAELLESVWRDRAADPHVVEAVVARLRRRLGPLGRHIGAVYRRGYVLRS